MVNLSVDTSSVDLIDSPRISAPSTSTPSRAMAGLLHRPSLSVSQRSNYALRESVLDLRRA